MRTDIERLRRVKEILNQNYSWLDVEFNEEEDYGIDLQVTGHTEDGDVPFEMEVKTITPSYGTIKDKDGNYGDFFCHIAARNRKWRWCATASSQSDFWADKTPSPELGNKPIHVLNAADKFGNKQNSKLNKLLTNNFGLIFLTKDWLIIFSPKQLKRAIVGYGWLYQEHTKELRDKSSKFEYKALLDLSKASKYIPL